MKREKQKINVIADYKKIEEALKGKIIDSTELKVSSMVVYFTDGSYLDVIKNINDVHFCTPNHTSSTTIE